MGGGVGCVRQQATKIWLIWTNNEVKDNFALLTEVSLVSFWGPFKSKFQVEIHFNVQSKSKAKWHGHSSVSCCRAAGLWSSWSTCTAVHFIKQWWSLECFYSKVCQSFHMYYTLIIGSAKQLTKCSSTELLKLETKRFWILIRTSFCFESELSHFFLHALSG